MPSGDPNCPPQVCEAKRINHLLKEEAEILMMVGSDNNSSSGDQQEVEAIETEEDQDADYRSERSQFLLLCSCRATLEL